MKLKHLFEASRISRITQPSTACNYAVEQGARVPELEPIILTKPRYAVYYAKNVIKGRWPEAEPIILKKANWSILYAKNVIKGRWPELEQKIIKKPKHIVTYAHEVINGRWPEAEPYILKDLWSTCLYAQHIIKGRWLEAEPKILKDSHHIRWYAQYIIKGRWLEAEPYITDLFNIYYYAKDILKGRMKIGEQKLLNSQPPSLWLPRYAKDIIKGRWAEAEQVLISQPCIHSIEYAQEVIKGRWIELEEIILKNVGYEEIANRYLRAFPEARKSSKDYPLVLGKYAIIDIPNVITDEQITKVFELIGLIYSERTLEKRIYDERLIRKMLNQNQVKQVTTKQIIHDDDLKQEINRTFGHYERNSDFD